MIISFHFQVARGNCFLEIVEGPQAGITCVTYALKKFTGGLGDDDDRDRGDNHTWKQYFTKVIIMEIIQRKGFIFLSGCYYFSNVIFLSAALRDTIRMKCLNQLYNIS